MNEIKKILLISCSLLFIQNIKAQNNSILLDGTDDKATIPHNNLFNIGETFTIEAWINANEWKSEVWAGSIVAKDGSGPDSGFAFRSGNNGALSFVMSVAGNWVEVASSPIMSKKVWSHVAVTVNSGSIKLFINGNEVANGSYNGDPIANTNEVVIGESSGFPGRAFDGNIDEVRIWSTARTGQQINDQYTTELTGDEEGLIAYYNMNEGEGTTISNAVVSTTNTNGTLDGPIWSGGFQLPTNDVGVVSLLAPDILTAFERPTKVKMKIQNFGFDDVSNIPVGYTLGGVEQQREVLSITLSPGETYEHTFSGFINLAEENLSIVNLFTDLADDPNELNDELSFVFEKSDDSASENKKILAINKQQHNFGSAGQTQFYEIIFPQDLSNYKQILMNIKVECPTGGCDPWDQPAKISVLENNEEFEIARFITPFGIGSCGPWTVDVTDFKTKLTGFVNLVSYIQVFGPSGWLLTVDFEFVKEDSPPTYQKLSPLWRYDYLVYGEPTVSYDLPEKSVTIDQNTTNSHLRMTVTGHGQGNTDNAAEFSDKTHDLMVNGSLAIEHRLWNPDCDVNPCSPQSGTWRFARAGWCPGQGVTPLTHDLSKQTVPGESITLDYELQEYTNELNTGYNGGSHTEPHYRIWGYLVETSANRYDDYINLAATDVNLPSDTVDGQVTFGAVTLTIQNTGNVTVENPKAAYFINGVMIAEEEITASLEPNSVTEYAFQTPGGFAAGNSYEIIAAVISPGDNNLGDDATLVKITNEDKTVTGLTDEIETKIKIFPNPSSDGRIHVQGLDPERKYFVKVYNTSGRIVGSWETENSDAIDLNINSAYLQIMTIADSKGEKFIYKLLRSR